NGNWKLESGKSKIETRKSAISNRQSKWGIQNQKSKIENGFRKKRAGNDWCFERIRFQMTRPPGFHSCRPVRGGGDAAKEPSLHVFGNHQFHQEQVVPPVSKLPVFLVDADFFPAHLLAEFARRLVVRHQAPYQFVESLFECRVLH